MANKNIANLVAGVLEKWIDNGDGTFSRQVYVEGVPIVSAGLWFGNGADGAFVLDGINDYPGIFALSGGNYNQARPVYASTISISPGVSLFQGNGPNCNPILASVSLTINGTIDSSGGNGGDASGATPGTAAGGELGYLLPGGDAGQDGGATNATGPTSGNLFPGMKPPSATGGKGGTGGGGPAAATVGSGGAYIPSSTADPFYRDMAQAAFAVLLNNLSTNSGAVVGLVLWPFAGVGGTGGSGGAGTTGGAGGAGGDGGNAIGIASPLITGTGTIQALGGNGGHGGNGATNGGGGGGGGGGMGGQIRAIANSFGSGLIWLVTGGVAGLGGAKAGTGVVGAAGHAGDVGTIIKYNPTTGIYS